MRLSQRDPRRPALVTIGALATITGCSLLTSFQGLSSGDVIDGGGSPDGAAAEASDAGDASADADAHDASTRPRAWRQLPVKGPAERHSARMAYDELRKNVVLVGNEETWLWDGAAWSNPTIVSPSGRSVGLAYDNARQVTVLSGGTGTTNERWEWNGSSWSGFAGAAGPGNAYHPGLAPSRRLLAMRAS